MAEEIYPAEVEKSLAKRKKKDPDFTPPEFDLRAMPRRDAFELHDGVLVLREAPRRALAAARAGPLAAGDALPGAGRTC